MRVEVVDVTALSQELVQRWQALQALTYAFKTPLLSPQFAQLIARHRGSARVAIGYEGDQAVAFFGFHPTSKGYARAMGAPFCDYQAIVSDPAIKLDGLAFLTAAGIKSLAFSSLMDPHGLFPHADMQEVLGYRIDSKGDSKAYSETLWAANPKWAKNIRRLTNKMDRELGPVRLVAFDTNKESYDTLMLIKSMQFHETGITDVLRPAWVKSMMTELFETQDRDFGGCLVSLYSGEKFVAGHFGVRQGDWFHPWIASVCPKAHPFSPGIIFLSEVTRRADGIGLRVIDLSEGHGHYKGQFCRDPVQVLAGIVGANPNTAPNQGQGALALIERRLDLITTVEPDFMGQVTAIGMAIAAVPRRLIARQKKSDQP